MIIDMIFRFFSYTRVYLKTHDVTGSEGFLRCARHFFAGILTYFKLKNDAAHRKSARCPGALGVFRYTLLAGKEASRTAETRSVEAVFSTSLAAPFFPPCRKRRGEKRGAGVRFGACCGAVQGSTCFIAVTNTRTHPTGAMVRAACYGTTDLQIIAFELLR